MSEIYKALAKFQQEVPIIHKDTQGFGYTYADLPKIIEVITPLLSKYNLGFTQPINGKSIKTIVYHTESGETIESEIDIPQGIALKGMNEFQVLGSAITYLRRYALSSLLGLVTDKDIDASGEQLRKTSSNKDLIEGLNRVKTTAELMKLKNYYSGSLELQNAFNNRYIELTENVSQ